MSAYDLEQLVCERLSALLIDRQFLCGFAGSASADALSRSIAAADMAAETVRSGSVAERAALLPDIVDRIFLQEDRIVLAIQPAQLAGALLLEAIQLTSTDLIELNLPVVKVRRGHQLRLVIPGPETISIDAARRDEKLVALIAEAHLARQLVFSQPDKSIAAIAAVNGRCRTRLGKLVALSCLAPDIVTAIVEGRQPQALAVRTLLDIELPLVWTDQHKLIGFA